MYIRYGRFIIRSVSAFRNNRSRSLYSDLNPSIERHFIHTQKGVNPQVRYHAYNTTTTNSTSRSSIRQLRAILSSPLDQEYRATQFLQLAQRRPISKTQHPARRHTTADRKKGSIRATANTVLVTSLFSRITSPTPTAASTSQNATQVAVHGAKSEQRRAFRLGSRQLVTCAAQRRPFHDAADAF